MINGRLRNDYRFPFRISPSGQAEQSPYAAHVGQMVRQVLLTSPGERVDLPEFGCGLRRLLFAPNVTGAPVPKSLSGVAAGDAMNASAQILVQQSLDRWLAGQIQVKQVIVAAGDSAPAGEIDIEVRYVLLETQDMQSTKVRLI